MAEDLEFGFTPAQPRAEENLEPVTSQPISLEPEIKSQSFEPPTVSDDSTDVYEIVSAVEGQEAARVATDLRAGGIDPHVAAKALRLKSRFPEVGIGDLMEQSDAFERIAAADDVHELLKLSPKTALAMSQNAALAAAGGRDMRQLGAIEGAISGIQKMVDSYNATVDQFNASRDFIAAQIEGNKVGMDEAAQRYSAAGNGVEPSWWNTVGNVAASIGYIMPRSIREGAMAGTAAAGLAAMTGPGAVAAGLGAFTTVTGASALAHIAEIEYGSEMLKHYNSGLYAQDPNKAILMSLGAATINTALERISLGIVAAPFKSALKNAVARTLPEKIAAAVDAGYIAVPTRAAAARAGLATVAKGGLSESAVEMFQEIPGIVNDIIAANMLGKENPYGANWQEQAANIAGQLADTFIDMMSVMPIMAAPGGLVKYHGGMKQVRAARESAKFMQDMASGAEASELRKIAPDAFHAVMVAQTEGTPVETLRVPADVVFQIKQDLGLSDEQMEQALPGITNGLADEAASGGTVEFKTADYAMIAGSQLAQKMQPEIIQPGSELSLREAAQVEAAVKAQFGEDMKRAKQARETMEKERDSLDAIEKDIRAQLEAAGHEKAQAKDEARWIRNIAAAQYSRTVDQDGGATKMSMSDWWDRYGINQIFGKTERSADQLLNQQKLDVNDDPINQADYPDVKFDNNGFPVGFPFDAKSPLSANAQIRRGINKYRGQNAHAGERSAFDAKQEADQIDFDRKNARPDSDTVSVVDLKYTAAPSGLSIDGLAAWLTNQLSAGGPVDIKSTGRKVVFNYEGVNDSLKRLRDHGHRESYSALRKLIETAAYNGWARSDNSTPKHRRIFGQEKYIAAMRYDDELYAVQISLNIVSQEELSKRGGEADTPEDLRYKGHALTDLGRIEIAPVSNANQGVSTGPSTAVAQLFRPPAMVPAPATKQGLPASYTEVTLGVLRGAVKPTKVVGDRLQQVQQNPESTFLAEQKKWLKWTPETADSSGKVWGAPPWYNGNRGSFKKLRDSLHMLIREGEVGRFWYEDSGNWVLNYVGGDVKEAERLIQLIAIYSPQMKIGPNLLMALRAYTFWKHGGKEGDLHLKTEVQDNKARAVLWHNEAWAGRKTNSFYQNLMYVIATEHEKECKAAGIDVDGIVQGQSTIDMWMKRAFGYESDATTDDKGKGQYAFCENTLKRITAELNSNLNAGEEQWTPHQVQAAIWSGIMTRYELAKDQTNQRYVKLGLAVVEKNDKGRETINYRVGKNGLKGPKLERQQMKVWHEEAMKQDSDTVKETTNVTARSYATEFERMTQVVTSEFLPSKNVPGAPDLLAASDAVKKAFTDEVKAIFEPEGKSTVAEATGVSLAFSQDSSGDYDGNVSPNVLTRLLPVWWGDAGVPSKGAVRRFCRIVQYVTRQDAVPFFRVENRPAWIAENKFKVVKPDGKTFRKYDTQREAEAVAAEKGEGFKVVGGNLAMAVVFNFSKTPSMETQRAFLGKIVEVLGPDTGFTRIGDTKLLVGNYRDENGIPFAMTDEEFAEKLESVGIDGIVSAEDRWIDSEYGHVQDWKNDPEGKAVLDLLEDANEDQTLERGGRSEGHARHDPLVRWKARYDEVLRRYTGAELAKREDEARDIQRSAENAGRLQQIAWHGSAARFIRFTLAHLGSGEGGAAHGWGLYFALNRSTAENYRLIANQARGADMSIRISGVDANLYRDNIARAAAKASGAEKQKLYDRLSLLDDFIASGASYVENEKAADNAAYSDEAYEWYRKNVVPAVEQAGALYRVEIPNDDELLDEDKPFSLQPPKVQQAIRDAWEEIYQHHPAQREAVCPPEAFDHTGFEIYQDLKVYADRRNYRNGDLKDYGEDDFDPKFASKILGRHGCKGMRYDGLKDGPCAVIWDAKAIDIRERLEQQLNQDGGETQGWFDQRTRDIGIENPRNASTFIHETSHWVMNTWWRMYNDGTASESVRADVDAVLKWMNVKDMDAWNAMSEREREPLLEQFSHSFEGYFFDKSPSSSVPTGIRGAFRRLADALRAHYRQLRDKIDGEYFARYGKHLPCLTQEVREVFDRMLAAEEDILKEASEIEYTPLFETLEEAMAAGMSEAQYRAYKDALDDRDQQAIADLAKKSLEELEVMQNAQARALRKWQAKWRAARKQVRDDVEVEVSLRPEYLVRDAWGDGLTIGGKTIKGKLNKDAVAALFTSPSQIEEGLRAEAAALRADIREEMDGVVRRMPEALAARALKARPASRQSVEAALGLDAVLTEIKALEDAVKTLSEQMKALPAEAQAPVQQLIDERKEALKDARSRRDKISPPVRSLEKRGMISDVGQTIDDAMAARYQYSSAAEMVKAMAKAKDVNEQVEALTEQEFKKRAGYLATDEAIKQEAKNRAYRDGDWRKLGYGDHGAMAADGNLDPAELATVMGWESAQAMIMDVVNAKPLKQAIEEETTRRMLRDHPEFQDENERRAYIAKALHNEFRTRALAIELAALEGAQKPVRLIVGAARRAARDIVSEMKISAVKVSTFKSREAKAAREAAAALKKGDTLAAISAKRRQLLASEQVRIAAEIETLLAKVARIEKFLQRTDKKLGEHYDVNLLEAARALLYIFRNGDDEYNSRIMSIAEALEKVKAYDQPMYAQISSMIQPITDEVTGGAGYKPMGELKSGQFERLGNVLDAIIFNAHSVKDGVISERLKARKEAIEELVATMEDKKQIEVPVSKHDRNGKYKAIAALQSLRAHCRRVEHWIDAMDGGNIHGPWRKFVWDPVYNGILKYWDRKAYFMKRFKEIADGVSEDLKRGQIDAPELGRTFTIDELLHVILHTGNSSNKEKLIIGHGWADALKQPDGSVYYDSRRFDAFIKRCFDNGIITKRHMDFCQQIWDLLEETKTDAQRAHYEMNGFYFSEITAEAIETPYGQYRGGYVPAVYDPDLVPERERDVDALGVSVNNSFMFPTGGSGFTKGRVQYNEPLQLDLNLIPNHIDKVLRYSFIEQPVKFIGAAFLGRNALSDRLNEIDPYAINDMIVPWLQRSVTQRVEEPGTTDMDRNWGRVFRLLKTNSGLSQMALNVVNTMQQLTGVFPAMAKIRPSLVVKSMVCVLNEPGTTADKITACSPFMQQRMENQATNIAQEAREILDINATSLDKLRAKSLKYGYCCQTVAQNYIDKVVWIASFQEAKEKGASDDDAIRTADRDVRLTQGGMDPQDLSAYESGSAFKRTLITQFTSYFLNMDNMLLTEVAKSIAKRSGLVLAGDMLRLYTMIVWMPELLSQVISGAFRGFDTGDDDFFDAYDLLRMILGTFVKSGLNGIPYLGSVATGVVEGLTGESKALKAPQGVAVSQMITVGQSIVDDAKMLYGAAAGEDTPKAQKLTKENLTALGLTGVPTVAAAKTLSYIAGVAAGEIQPESNLDVLRGLASGLDVNRKR